MITMTVIAQVKPEKQQEFLQALGSLYGNQEEKEKGLKKTTLYQEINVPTGFRLIAEWETQKDLERYLRAEPFRVLLGTLEVLCKESEIRYSQKTENVPNIGRTPMLLLQRSGRGNQGCKPEKAWDILEGKNKNE